MGFFVCSAQIGHYFRCVVAGDRLDGEGEEVRDGGREWDVSSAARAGELPAAAARPDDAAHAASQRRYVATM